MSTVEEIKEAIAKLSPREYCELMAELHPWDDDEWDRQMKSDFAWGKMDWLIRETEEEIQGGRTVPLDQVLDEK